MGLGINFATVLNKLQLLKAIGRGNEVAFIWNIYFALQKWLVFEYALWFRQLKIMCKEMQLGERECTL